MLRTRHGRPWRSASETSSGEARMHVKARARRTCHNHDDSDTRRRPVDEHQREREQAKQRGRKSGEGRLGRCSRVRGCCALRAINWGVRETNVVV
jgi:hypothetical protein